MSFVWFMLIGIISGIIAGMGLGGGTLLIPLLTIFMSVSQPLAQGINLIVFVPMAIIVSVIYIKNKLINFKYYFVIAIPAVIVAFVGALVSFQVSKQLLKIVFGCFVCVIGLIQLIYFVYCKVKKIEIE